MNKKALLALLLAMTLLLSSCSLVATNTKKDEARAVVAMNGENVLNKADAKNWLDYWANYIASYQTMQYQYYYAMMGMEYNGSFSAADVMDQAKEYMVTVVKETAVIEAQAKAQGISLTDEEMADVKAQAAANNSNSKYTNVYERLLAADKLQSKLKEAAVGNLTMTDEEIAEAVAEEKASYETNPSAYASNVMNGSDITYRPAGYRLVRNLLVKYADEDSTKITSLTTSVSTQTSSMNTYKTAVEGVEGADLEALLANVSVTVTDTESGHEAAVTSTFEATEDETTKTLYTNVENYAKAKALQAAYQADLDAAMAAGKAAVQEQVDAVMARLDAGEDFQTVMADANGDTSGASSYPDGYPVCADCTAYDSAFVTAAMSVETVGQYSQPSWGVYGAYIAQYASDVEEGPVTETVLANKKDEVFDAQMDTWVEAAQWVVRMEIMD